MVFDAVADASGLAFTGFPLDRADHLRANADGLASLMARDDARIAMFWRAQPLVTTASGDTVAPAFRNAQTLDGAGATTSVFMGLDGAKAPVFVGACDPTADPPAALLDAGAARFEELRTIAPVLSPVDLSLLGAARGILSWHAAHGFCSACGAPSQPAHGGWKRVCPECETEHFPRVDPVTIMLITLGDSVLLGRGRNWPENAYSCLAGFVEPGETLGDATRREAKEEAGVELGDVSYIISQPWPFPSSFMLGVRAEAKGDALTIDPNELADARWFTRAEIAEVMAGTHPAARTPPAFAVANYLLRWWLANG